MHDIFNLFYTTASATALWAARSVDMCSVGQTIAFIVAQIVVPSACLKVKPFYITQSTIAVAGQALGGGPSIRMLSVYPKHNLLLALALT